MLEIPRKEKERDSWGEFAGSEAPRFRVCTPKTYPSSPHKNDIRLNLIVFLS